MLPYTEVTNPYIPINSCKRERIIHAFLNKKTVYTVDIQETKKKEQTRIKSPVLQAEIQR